MVPSSLRSTFLNLIKIKFIALSRQVGCHDIITPVRYGVRHHRHPLLHYGRVVLHVDIEAHRFRPGCRGAAGSTIVRPEGFNFIY